MFAITRSKHRELKHKVEAIPYQWKRMRVYGVYSLLHAVEQKLNSFTEEVRLRLFNKKVGKSLFITL
jgi:predicted nucleotidyltransferase